MKSATLGLILVSALLGWAAMGMGQGTVKEIQEAGVFEWTYALPHEGPRCGALRLFPFRDRYAVTYVNDDRAGYPMIMFDDSGIVGDVGYLRLLVNTVAVGDDTILLSGYHYGLSPGFSRFIHPGSLYDGVFGSGLAVDGFAHGAHSAVAVPKGSDRLSFVSWQKSDSGELCLVGLDGNGNFLWTQTMTDGVRGACNIVYCSGSIYFLASTLDWGCRMIRFGRNGDVLEQTELDWFARERAWQLFDIPLLVVGGKYIVFPSSVGDSGAVALHVFDIEKREAATHTFSGLGQIKMLRKTEQDEFVLLTDKGFFVFSRDLESVMPLSAPADFVVSDFLVTPDGGIIAAGANTASGYSECAVGKLPASYAHDALQAVRQ